MAYSTVIQKAQALLDEAASSASPALALQPAEDAIITLAQEATHGEPGYDDLIDAVVAFWDEQDLSTEHRERAARAKNLESAMAWFLDQKKERR